MVDERIARDRAGRAIVSTVAAARLRQIADWVASAMFAAVFVIFNYKIFTRYFEHDEAVWADEVLVILFIWIVFWAQAFVVREQDQISFDSSCGYCRRRRKRIAAVAAQYPDRRRLSVALPGSLGYIRFLWREHTPVLNLPLDLGLFLLRHVPRGDHRARACSARGQLARRALARSHLKEGAGRGRGGVGLWVLLGVFTLAAVLGAPLGLAMLAAGYVYLITTHQDVGLVVDQTMNGLYNSYLLIAVPMFIFVANVMNASGVIETSLELSAPPWSAICRAASRRSMSSPI